MPNWLSFIILIPLEFLVPAWSAEKLLLIFYLAGMAISFRLLIRQFAPENLQLSILILPFSNTFLLHLGFYNYSISFIFLFLTLAYWIRNRNSQKTSRHYVMLALLTLTYFSAILTFVFAVLCLVLLQLYYSLKALRATGSLSQVLKETVRQLLFLLLAALPAIVLSVWFIQTMVFSRNHGAIPAADLAKFLNDIRCLVVFYYQEESILTNQLLHLLLAMASISLWLRFGIPNAHRSRCHAGDVFLIGFLFAIMLLFTVPDNSGAGMMSDRFLLQAYLFFILWICLQPMPRSVGIFFRILVIFIHADLLFVKQKAVVELNHHAATISSVASHIDPHSIVLPINMSGNWLEPHFGSYLGLNQPMVLLDNYEPSMGWFPVTWNFAKIPRVQLGELDRLRQRPWPTNLQGTNTKQIDYVFLYGDVRRVNDSDWTELKIALATHYDLLATSEDFFTALYSKKSTSTTTPVNADRIK